MKSVKQILHSGTGIPQGLLHLSVCIFNGRYFVDRLIYRLQTPTTHKFAWFSRKGNRENKTENNNFLQTDFLQKNVFTAPQSEYKIQIYMNDK